MDKSKGGDINQIELGCEIVSNLKCALASENAEEFFQPFTDWHYGARP
jgi:hypothetical protein